MKLLIVDDSMMVRKALEKFLSQMRVEIVGTAGDGKQALELFKQHMPDIVTLDITMPEMDGLTAMKEMLALKADTKIIIISALNSKDVMVQALTDGAQGYVVKPFTSDKLLEQINKAMGS